MRILRYGLLRRMRAGGRRHLFLTMDCNLKCYYCMNRCYGGVPVYSDLYLVDWCEIIDNIDYPVQEFFITGGEPFVKKWLPDLVNYILDNTNAMVTIFTNLTLTARICEFVEKVRKKRRVRFVATAHIGCDKHEFCSSAWVLKNWGFHFVVDGFDNDDDPVRCCKVRFKKMYSRKESIEWYANAVKIGWAPDGTAVRSQGEVLNRKLCTEKR